MRTIDETTLQSYKNHIYTQEKSQNTIDKYIRDIRTFTAWLQTQEHKDITKDCVIRYKKYLEAHYRPSSTNSMLTALNGFFEYTGWHDLKDPAKPHLRAGKRDDARRIRKTHQNRKRAGQPPSCHDHRDHRRHRHPRQRACVHHSGCRKDRKNQHILQRKTPRDLFDTETKKETARLLQKEKHQKRSGIHHKKRKPGGPQQHLDGNEKGRRKSRRCTGKSIPAQPPPLLRAHLLQHA